MSIEWIKDEKKSESHWMEVRDKDGWWAAIVKWDGCVDFYRYLNQSLEPSRAIGSQEDNTDQLVDYMHLCGVDETLGILVALKEKAKDHFGSDWK